jgi:hypothetical protein
MHELTIHIGHRADGFVFRLDPASVLWVKKQPKRLQSMPTISIGFDDRIALSALKDEVFTQVAEMLTGLRGERLGTLEFKFIDSRNQRIVHTIEARPAVVLPAEVLTLVHA